MNPPAQLPVESARPADRLLRWLSPLIVRLPVADQLLLLLSLLLLLPFPERVLREIAEIEIRIGPERPLVATLPAATCWTCSPRVVAGQASSGRRDESPAPTRAVGPNEVDGHDDDNEIM